MLSRKSDQYLNEILSRVKFTFDRASIRKELEDHIADKMEYYMKQGYEAEEAEQHSIQDMGDAEEIGNGLNKEHNPIIGWLWRITSVMAGIGIVIVCFIVVINILTLLNSTNSLKIPKSDIEYQINVNKKVKIDDRVIRFTKVIFDTKGDMNIFYETYYARTWGGGWTLGTLGEITDNLGNQYTTKGEQQFSGIISKGVLKIIRFSKEADKLLIRYDWYNRSYHVEIPLKEGGTNE